MLLNTKKLRQQQIAVEQIVLGVASNIKYKPNSNLPLLGGGGIWIL
jgi:hypothetical protein